MRRSTNLASSSLWIVPLKGDPPVQVTSDEHMDLSPVWTPDGSSILFVSDRGGAQDVWSLSITASGGVDGVAKRISTT